jgi:ferredoxin, 2Fe-2S
MPRVTFLPAGLAALVEPGTTLLEAAEAAGVEVPHNCGGVCACVTCHVWVEKGLASLGELSEGEDEKLNEAAGLDATSRLSCQATVGDEEIVVRVPNNRIAS